MHPSTTRLGSSALAATVLLSSASLGIGSARATPLSSVERAAVLTDAADGPREVASPEVSFPALELAPRELTFRLDRGFELGAPSLEVDLMLPFRDASVERLGPLRLYRQGRYGQWQTKGLCHLSWGAPRPGRGITCPVDATTEDESDDLHFTTGIAWPGSLRELIDRRPEAWMSPSVLPKLASTGSNLRSDGAGTFWQLPPTKPVVDWRCRRSPVRFIRYGAEHDAFDLVRCDGSTAYGALDRLSILARPPEVKKPDGLPDEPNAEAWSKRREWVDGVRIMHPRLLWLAQELADAFPRRGIYIYSGYRPFAEVNDGTGHKSLHASGRALDIGIERVPNEEVFKKCRALKDVGCGFYPHGKFVHVDVRRAHTGKAFWIDASEPGEPTKYVDSWPGVVDEGGLAWSGERGR